MENGCITKRLGSFKRFGNHGEVYFAIWDIRTSNLDRSLLRAKIELLDFDDFYFIALCNHFKKVTHQVDIRKMALMKAKTLISSWPYLLDQTLLSRRSKQKATEL